LCYIEHHCGIEMDSNAGRDSRGIGSTRIRRTRATVYDARCEDGKADGRPQEDFSVMVNKQQKESKVMNSEYKITSQHTYSFPETGESVTAYVSDTSEAFKFAIGLNHKGEGLKWSGHYEGFRQIQSKVNPLIWYIWLSGYWDTGENGIPIERVMMVRDCNASHHE
jgi:hypothetical protein